MNPRRTKTMRSAPPTLPEHAIEVSRTMLANVADIMGPQSAAAQALRDATGHAGEVRFWFADRTYFVEKLPATASGA
jgi:hypothetical protein